MLLAGRRGEVMGEKGADSGKVRTASHRTRHGDVRSRRENTVNNTVITMKGGRWVLDFSW